MFFPRKVAEKFEVHLTPNWINDGIQAQDATQTKRRFCPNFIRKFFADPKVKLAAMVSMPFILFWAIGGILQAEMDYLVKLGLFVCVYVYR
jgi:hypothetical protein